MIIIRYLLWRFCLYWGAVSAILATLFVTIDFFSKLQGHSGEGFSRLVSYFAWSVVPTIFEVLPVSIWLASLLLLRELSRRNEFEAMVLTGMSSSFLLYFGVLAGLLGMLFTCGMHDYCMEGLLSAAQRQRRELIKGSAARVIENRWLLLDPGLIGSISRLDCASGRGSGLALFKTYGGLVQSITTADQFCMQSTMNSSHLRLCLHEVSVLKADGGVVETNKAAWQTVPNFLYTLQGDQRDYSLVQSLSLVLHKSRLDGVCAGRDMLCGAVDRVVYFLSLLFYPVVTITPFVLMPHVQLIGWLGAFSPYLFFNGCKLFLGLLVAAGVSPLILFAPYLLMTLSGLLLAVFALLKRCFARERS